MRIFSDLLGLVLLVNEPLEIFVSLLFFLGVINLLVFGIATFHLDARSIRFCSVFLCYEGVMGRFFGVLLGLLSLLHGFFVLSCKLISFFLGLFGRCVSAFFFDGGLSGLSSLLGGLSGFFGRLALGLGSVRNGPLGLLFLFHGLFDNFFMFSLLLLLFRFVFAFGSGLFLVLFTLLSGPLGSFFSIHRVLVIGLVEMLVLLLLLHFLLARPVIHVLSDSVLCFHGLLDNVLVRPLIILVILFGRFELMWRRLGLHNIANSMLVSRLLLLASVDDGFDSCTVLSRRLILLMVLFLFVFGVADGHHGSVVSVSSDDRSLISRKSTAVVGEYFVALACELLSRKAVRVHVVEVKARLLIRAKIVGYSKVLC